MPSINKEGLSQIPNNILLIAMQQFRRDQAHNGHVYIRKIATQISTHHTTFQDNGFQSLNIKINYPFSPQPPVPMHYLYQWKQQQKIIINLKNSKQTMFYYPPAHYCPQYLYYVCVPSHQTIPQYITTEDHPPKEALATRLQVSPDEERLILTREDLEKQGYEQTKRPWTAEEDKLLMKLYRDHHARFDQIAAKVEGRNAKMCYSRYRRLTYEIRATWAKEQDLRLLSLVKHHGEDAWRAIAPQFEGRSYKQLKDHYLNYLKPDLLKSEWTIEEDLQLIRLINLHGKSWRLVEEGLQGRSRNQIKNRYFGRLVRLNRRKVQVANGIS